MSFIFPTPEQAPIPAVRTDTAKFEALKDAVMNKLGVIPAGTTADQVDIFALAVAINGDIDEGTLTALVRGDFDGTDITEIVTELIAAV